MDNIEYVPAKTIVSGYRPGGDWFGANYNMNIYRGCSHDCIYCDSRSECYGDDTFGKIKVKEGALRLINDELRRKRKTGVIATGSMSDPYNPLERELELTRAALRLVALNGFGVAIATKSPLITRDIDILCEIKERSPAICKITITAEDDCLSRIIEPGTSGSVERFGALSELSAAGIFSGVLLMPVLPFITDTQENITKIVERAAQCGARFIYPAFGVTLRDRQREYYYARLDESFPGLREKYERLYGANYSCSSPAAPKLYKVFEAACRAHGILYKMQHIVAASKRGYGDNQLSLF